MPKKAKTEAPTGWTNRIVGYTDRPVTELADNPLNWRTHPQEQLEPLLGTLQTLGVIQNVIFNVRSGRLIDGHARVLLARQQGVPSVMCTDVDLSEEEEAFALSVYDPLGSRAGKDQAKLDSLIASLGDEFQQVQMKVGAGLVFELTETEIKDAESGAEKRANPLTERQATYQEKHGDDHAANIMQIVVDKAEWDDVIAAVKRIGQQLGAKTITDAILGLIRWGDANISDLPKAEQQQPVAPAPTPTEAPADSGVTFEE